MGTNENKVSDWALLAHQMMILDGYERTAHDLRFLVGSCPGSAQQMLDKATRLGYFMKNGKQYRAIPYTPPTRRRPGTSKSWFDGLKRVRSVFELGQD